MNIIPFQSKFDKDFPVVIGNAEYNAECELLKAMDIIIATGGMEETFIKYSLDVACVNKAISLFGTCKSPRLTAKEIEAVRENAIFALRASILRKHLRLPLRRFVLALSHSDLYKWFCRINRFSTPTVPGKSTINDYENMMPAELTKELDAQLQKSVQSDTCSILDEPVDFSQCYLDSTCIQANIHFPVDWVLLRDAVRTMMLAVKRIRNLDLKNRMPMEPKDFISQMNKLCIEMTHTRRKKDSKRKRKAIFRKMKKVAKVVANHAIKHFELLDKHWEQTGLSRKEAEQILGQISNVVDKLARAIKNAHERIIGERQVANEDKLLSLYEDAVNVIVRHKSGAEVEFGNTLLLVEQHDGLIVDWKLFRKQAPSDSKLLQDSHKRITGRLGDTIRLVAGDRNFDSDGNREYLKANDIFNAVCPRDPKLLQSRLEEDLFCQGQRRRGQTEGRISILGRCFCGNPMVQKGFDHREQHLGWSILSHNIWLLARMKISQDKQALQKVA
jgi:hypothetical protein